VEGLGVQITNSFVSDILVDAEDDWLESGAIVLICTFTLRLVTETAISVSVSLHGTAEELTTVGLAGKAEISGRLDETNLVDHEADLGWQLHEWEGNVLDLLGLLLALLGLLLALLGSLLLLLCLKLSLDGVS
jgi:hypothetical protein